MDWTDIAVQIIMNFSSSDSPLTVGMIAVEPKAELRGGGFRLTFGGRYVGLYESQGQIFSELSDGSRITRSTLVMRQKEARSFYDRVVDHLLLN